MHYTRHYNYAVCLIDGQGTHHESIYLNARAGVGHTDDHGTHRFLNAGDIPTAENLESLALSIDLPKEAALYTVERSGWDFEGSHQTLLGPLGLCHYSPGEVGRMVEMDMRDCEGVLNGDA